MGVTVEPEHDIMLTAQDISEMFQIPVTRVYDLDLPWVRIGRRRRVWKSAVLAWTEQQRDRPQ